MSDSDSSDDNEFPQIQELINEQYIAEDKKEIWWSHPVSPSNKRTLSCNILWQEVEPSQVLKEYIKLLLLLL